MLDFKIEAYKKETGLDFPAFYRLSPEESLEIINRGSAQPFSTLENIYPTLQSRLHPIESAIDTDDLQGILDVVNIHPETNITIYYNESEAIVMAWGDVLKVWENLWYDVGDEAVILIFQEQQRIVLITHWGQVYN